MNRVIFTFIIAMLFVGIQSIGQSNVDATSAKKNVVFSDISPEGFTASIKISDYKISNHKLNSQNFFTLDIPSFGSSVEIGYPQLSVYKQLLELPEGANVEIEIIDQQKEIIDLNKKGISNLLKPAQKSVAKIKDAKVEFHFNKAVYKTDANYSKDLVKIFPLGKMRSVSIARLEFSPMSYNPISNTIEIITKLKFKVKITAYDAVKLEQEKLSLYSPFFIPQSQILLNSGVYESQTKVTYNQYPNKYVIVADSMFKESLQPFIDWKEQKGFKVIEAYLQDANVGTTTTSIKAYLQGLYNSATATNPAPSYVLFVGDVAQMPAWNSTTGGSHVSDLHYCEYTNDFLPEVMYGRFSANDTSELNPQINKTIEYEKYLMADPSYLGKSVLISGYDGSGHGPTYGDGQVNYGVAEYFNSTNSSNCKSWLFINGSYNKDTEIFQTIDSGVSIANYTAHGANDGWDNPSFKVVDVANMTNKGKYPLMIGNACITNHFNSAVCFGEGLLRAKDKGAIGYIGASDNTYWDEDYYWAVGYGAIVANPSYSSTGLGLYDRMFHTNNEQYSDWAMSSFQYLLAGNLAVSQSGGNYTNYYYEIYHVMGDPSLMAYQKVPAQITAYFPPFIPVNTTTYQVNTVPHAMVAISQNASLITSIMSDSNGLAVLQLGNSFSVTGNIDIVITAQNYAPYFNTVVGGAATGPYVISSNFVIDDTIANNNNVADFGENIFLDVDFSNLTSHNSVNTTASIQSSDNQISIVNANCNVGNVQAFDTLKTNNSFNILINDAAIDGHVVNADIIVTDNSGASWTSPITFPVYAPNIVIGESLMRDTLVTGGNGVIEAGEEIIVKVKVYNTGSRDAINVICDYTSQNSSVTVLNNETIANLTAGSYQWVSFKVKFDNSMTQGQFADILFSFVSGAYSGSKIIGQVVGEFDEDFETGAFAKYNWDISTDKSWAIDSTVMFEGDYSMRSAATLGDDEISSISLTMNVLTADTLSFYSKVSTESGYDKFSFIVDGDQKGEWSGNKAWFRKDYLISSGTHTFTWQYAKDYYQTANLDAVWVDYIKFPPTDAWSSLEYNEEANISEITLWPNPTADDVNLSMNLKNNDPITISVYNQLGQKVMADAELRNPIIGETNVKLNVSNLASGAYIVHINQAKQQFYQKLIIK